MKEEIIKAQEEFQIRTNKLLQDGAECRIMDGKELVTSFYLASFEVLKAVPFISRSTGKVLRFTYWCWFQEVHFEAGMNRSHLVIIKDVEWLNDRNLQIVTDDYRILICVIDPPEVDPDANEVYKEWKAFQKTNPWLSEITDQQREEFLDMVRRAIS
ncbi:MAG: hypothetical protein P9X24_02145 [Candidatus Hatepunaea meridiana]|nr:hypothetical protein [Candidatus Hatepunaea meridiana]